MTFKRQVTQPADGQSLICVTCRAQKPYAEFYRATPGSMNDRTYGGFDMPCKECNRVRRRDYARTARARARQNELRRSGRYRERERQAAAQKRAARTPEEIDAQSAYLRAYHAAHREERLAAMRAKYHAPDGRRRAQVLESTKRRRATPEGRAAHNAANRARDKTDRGRALKQHRCSLRRARIAGVPHTLTLAEWEHIKECFGHRCAYCGEKPMRLEKDHIIPIARGGHHTRENIAPACRSCNGKKWIKDTDAPLREHPYR